MTMYSILHIPTAKICECTGSFGFKISNKFFSTEEAYDFLNSKYVIIDSDGVTLCNRNNFTRNLCIKPSLHEFEILEVDDV